MTREVWSRPLLPLYALGVGGAAVIGITASHLVAVAVGVATLLPIWAHLRHVGFRRAVTEPTPIMFIVAFYVLVFPLRAFVIATSGYTDVFLGRGAVSSKDMVAILLMASAGTTALVESYYLAARRSRANGGLPHSGWATEPLSPHIVRLAWTLAFLSFAGLAGVLFKYGSISAAQGVFLSHSKDVSAADASLTDSAWQLFAVPAVWCAACVAIDRVTLTIIRVVFASIALAILTATLVIYGSRLGVILALMGIWVLFHYSGRRVPVRFIVILVPVFILGSNVLVSARTSTPTPRLPAVERYSRIAGYGVLDVSLAVWRQPALVRAKLLEPQRWLDLPAYLAPSAVWPGRPNISARRLDLYVAQAVGSQNDQATGFPITYLMEDWLIGGWPAVLLLSVVGGVLLGWADRKLIGGANGASPARLLVYCFIVTAAFGYYKDGDILSTFVGEFRTAAYLSVLLCVTGVWTATRRKREGQILPEPGRPTAAPGREPSSA